MTNKIDGSTGNNSLVGTQQNDRIYGYAGDDTLIGNAGDDLLEGGLGNDTLTGGPGSDTFVLYYSGGGIDTITDFTIGVDYLEVKSAPNVPSKFPPYKSGYTNLGSINTGAVDDFLPDDANTSTLDSIGTSGDFTAGNVGDKPITDVITPDLITLSSNNPSFRYDAKTGALFYSEQHIAWIPNFSLGQTQPTTTTKVYSDTLFALSNTINVYSDMLPAPILNDI